ncbi:MAG: polysaccharide deacetylase family protein [Candidatus Peregrinibacteria bacterium]|nr:polysaccharide deacetylase family protein [Candidatus Peregrinibacteria bacterium]
MKALKKYRGIKSFTSTVLFVSIIISGCGNIVNTEKNKPTDKTATTQITDQKPVIKEVPAVKTEQLIVEHGPRDKKNIALTFDADMTPSMLKKLQTKKVKTLYDKRITDTLEETSTPATIFITGLWAETYPEETKNLSKNPLFEIANHSLTHGSFTKECYGLGLVPDKNKELSETQKILKELTNLTPKYFRFPGGCYRKEDLKIVANEGLIPVQWDVISGDAFQKDSSKISSTVINKTTNGSIIVMHLNGAPNAPGTAEALPSIIKELKKKGYTFVKMSELLSGNR